MPPQPVVVEQAESMTTISAVVATTTEATAAAATTTTNGHVRDDVEEDEDVKSEQQQEPQHDDMDDRMSAVSSSIASSEIGIGGVINRSVAGSESLSPSPPPLPAIEPPDEQTRGESWNDFLADLSRVICSQYRPGPPYRVTAF